MGHRLQLSVGVAAQLVLIECHAKAGPGRRVDAEIREAQRLLDKIVDKARGKDFRVVIKGGRISGCNRAPAKSQRSPSSYWPLGVAR
jgi:hypothetical protein